MELVIIVAMFLSMIGGFVLILIVNRTIKSSKNCKRNSKRKKVIFMKDDGEDT